MGPTVTSIELITYETDYNERRFTLVANLSDGSKAPQDIDSASYERVKRQGSHIAAAAQISFIDRVGKYATVPGE
jgi:hypothetical protein